MGEILGKIKVPVTKPQRGAVALANLKSDKRGAYNATFDLEKGVLQYTLPARTVVRDDANLITYINANEEVITINRDADIYSNAKAAFGSSVLRDIILRLNENIAKSISSSTGDVKATAAIYAYRIASSTVKKHYVDNQSWGEAGLNGTLSNIKLKTIYDFKHASSNKWFQKAAKKVGEIKNVSAENSYYLLKKENVFKSNITFNLASGTYGADNILGSLNLYNAKKAIFGGHPQEKINSEQVRNSLKVVSSIQTDTDEKINNNPTELRKSIALNARRRLVIANAIIANQQSVELPEDGVILDLRKYRITGDVRATIAKLDWNKATSTQRFGYNNVMAGNPPSAQADLFMAVANVVVAQAKEVFNVAQFYIEKNYSLTDNQVLGARRAKEDAGITRNGGEITENPDGSRTVTFDYKKMNKIKVDETRVTQRVNQKIVVDLNKRAADKKLKDEQSRQLLNVKSFYSAISAARNIKETNTGLGINTQRGPTTGVFGQNMGWTTNK